MSIPINKEQLALVLDEIRGNPVLARIFSNWMNLILHWEPRHLHGLTDIAAIEVAVALSMYEVEAANDGVIPSLLVDITRPIAFSYTAKEQFIHKEIVVKPPLMIPN